MPELAISRAKLLDFYRDQARTQENLSPFYEKFKFIFIIIYLYIFSFISLMKKNNYVPSLIFNLDETSLVIKKPHRPSVVWKRDMCYPAFHPAEQIFSCTVIFIVSADGCHCRSTLLLNSKADMKFLKDFSVHDVDIRFIKYI